MSDGTRPRQPAKGSPEEITSAHAWLDAVVEELDLNHGSMRALIKDLLDLTKHVAHGPSRPAAPLTAFLVGVSVGRQLDGTASTEQEVAATRARIEAVEKLLERYSRKDN